MNPNSWQFNRQELNTLALSLHTPTQRLGWGRRLYRFEVAGQGYWLKYQSLSEHAALINLSSMKYFSFLASFGKLAYLDLSNKPL